MSSLGRLVGPLLNSWCEQTGATKHRDSNTDATPMTDKPDGKLRARRFTLWIGLAAVAAAALTVALINWIRGS